MPINLVVLHDGSRGQKPVARIESPDSNDFIILQGGGFSVQRKVHK